MFRQSFRKFQHQLKLQNQIIILLLLSTIIPVSIVGLYGVSSSTTALSVSAQEQMEAASAKEAKNISAFLDGISGDVLLLKDTPPVQGIIRARDGGGVDQLQGGNSPYSLWVERMKTIFIAMMKSRSPRYMEIRYLEEKGKELVRIVADGNNIKVVPEAELKNKANTTYFKETMKLSPDNVYVSSLDLNQENGQIEQPYKPVIRYATPIIDSAGQKRGIIIADVFASKFLQAFKDDKTLVDGKQAFLVNQDGYYMSHPNPKKEWGFDFHNNEKLEKDYSVKVAKQILGTEQGYIDEGDNLLSYYKIDYIPKQPEFLVVIDKFPKSSVFAAVNSFKTVAILIIVVSLAVVLPVGVFGTRQIINLIKQLVNVISASSQQTFCALEEQERIASQQAASVNETTATMDELEASCRQSAEQAKAAAAAAQQVLALAKDGTQAVAETKEGMFTLEKKVEAIAEQILHLSEQASQIGNISRFVSDVANQTNMLAINSSVEAVRAGEHGKGFALIANEIRKLSDQSQKSAENIKVLVSNIQKAINSTVMVTEEGEKTVKTGVQIAQKTDQTFAGVADAVNHMVLNNQQILLNLKQQLNAIQQIVQAMDTINKGARETATGISQTRDNTEQLNKTALTLKRIV